MAASRIPIQNIYYLLAYAWDCLDEAGTIGVGADEEMRLPDLFARLMSGGVAHLLKRGVQREYATVREEIAGVRGRLEFGQSVKSASFPRGRAWCAYDELGPDTEANRIIKTTLRRLARVEGVASPLVSELRDLYRRMPGVAEARISRQGFARLTLGSQARFYRFVLQLCALIHENLYVDESREETHFRDFTRDNRQMHRLFERFLFRFYEKEQQEFTVSAPHLRWNLEGDASDVAMIPIMRTDLVLSSPKRTIVADAKYYSETLSERFGASTVRSGHLYQLMAYLRHIGRPAAEAAGLLIYPRTSGAVRVNVQLDGFAVRVATVNLDQDWGRIHEELVGLVAGRWSAVAQ